MQKFLCLLILFPVFVRAQTIAITGDDWTCVGYPGFYLATVTGTFTPHFKWIVNSTHVGSDSSFIAIDSLNDGDTVKCLLTNAVGDTVFAVSNRIIVSIDPEPHAEIFFIGKLPNPIGALCVGKSAELNSLIGFTDVYSKYGLVSVYPTSITAVSVGIDSLYTFSCNSCGDCDTFYRQLIILGPTIAAAPITAGTTHICIGDTLQLHTTTSEAVQWHSKYLRTSVSGRTTAIVNGIEAGVDTITLQVYNGCASAFTSIGITVDPPSTINGEGQVCVGTSIDLLNKYPGGLWQSDDPSIASIDDIGRVYGLAPGTVNISYSIGSCIVTKKERVYATPVITGNNDICLNRTTTLMANTEGHEWYSSDNTVVSIDSFGLVHTIDAGDATITYVDKNGCWAHSKLTVNPLPPAITGNSDICLGHGDYLYNDAPGGKWLSNDANVASIDSFTGFARGYVNSTAAISYMLPTGCYTSKYIQVNYCYEPQLIYPNPAYNEITIEADTLIYPEYSLVNSVGQMVMHAPIKQTFTKVDISPLPHGTYFIRLHSYNRDFVQKFVKE